MVHIKFYKLNMFGHVEGTSWTSLGMFSLSYADLGVIAESVTKSVLPESSLGDCTLTANIW